MPEQTPINFTLPCTSGETFSLSDQRGRSVVVYFYPKDSTPGCTTEAQDFRNAFAEFNKLNCCIVGVSRDSLRSHQNFVNNQCLPFPLLSDPDEVVCTQFDVMRLKNMYGKQVRGIERSTFLIDSTGVIVREWRGVKVNGHVQEVLAAVHTLSS